MTPTELQTFLHTYIPATAALNLRVIECHHDKVSLALPHAGNQNHKNTVFGGSMALAATTCGWALTHINFPEADGNIVVQQGQTRYLRPALSDITLTVRTASATDWPHRPHFITRHRVRTASATDWAIAHDDFERHGKGKITLETEIYSQNILVAVFSGRYVILGNR